jgi:hypothetical protein
MMDETSGPVLVENRLFARMPEFVVGGFVLSLVSLAVVVYAAYHGWYEQDLSGDWAYAGVGYGFLFYAMGAFIFAYGWQGGETMKTLRMGLFICAATFVVILALIALLKMRADAAAKGASAVAAGGKADFDSMAMLQTAGSMLIPETEEEALPKLSHTDGPFQLTCGHCGLSFAPAPPYAKCPYCGTEALSEG